MANVVFAKRLVAASVFQLSFIQNNDNGPFLSTAPYAPCVERLLRGPLHAKVVILCSSADCAPNGESEQMFVHCRILWYVRRARCFAEEAARDHQRISAQGRWTAWRSGRRTPRRCSRRPRAWRVRRPPRTSCSSRSTLTARTWRRGCRARLSSWRRSASWHASWAPSAWWGATARSCSAAPAVATPKGTTCATSRRSPVSWRVPRARAG